MSTKSRQYDLILLGATGFTGKLTAEYITKHLPRDLNWAVAGRNSKKLSAIVNGLKELDSERTPPAVEVAEISGEQLDNLVRKTRVLITTVGPYHRFGTPIIEACAKSGTHYLDCTGETPWHYHVAHKYHEVARSNAAILIPQCAMDSAPADLAAFVLTSFIREKLSSDTAKLIHSIQEFNNDASGGTLHSLLTVAASYPLSHLRKAMQPYSLCVDGPPASHPSPSNLFNVFGTRYVPELGLLSDSILGVPDATLVWRSWGLMDGGKEYGKDFDYLTGMKVAGRIRGFLWHYSMAIGMAVSFPMLRLSPIRRLLTKVLPPPGEGPTEESQAKSSTTWKSLARSKSEPSQTAVCNMFFPEHMYALTAILLSEAAIVLLRPDHENWAQKLGGGVLTPATLGHQYVERVRAAGVKIEVEMVEGEGKTSG